MFSILKSIGSKAISIIPSFSIKSKLVVPCDPDLQQKLNTISSLILKTEQNQQFKVYQQLQSIGNVNFNRNLRIIYQHQSCTTQTINCIIRFYTFLLTNCKNQLVICKLVSQPLVIQLTKIVLSDQTNSNDSLDNKMNPIHSQSNKIQNEIIINQKSDKVDQKHNQSQVQPIISSQLTQSQPISIASLHTLCYLNEIDWQQVNAYKVALIRSYINCINPQTIKYMIIQDQLPIFVNCINGYKHYLTDGVQGTCISNCILMILTKVNCNDQVCQILFDQQHYTKSITQTYHTIDKNLNIFDQNNNKIDQKDQINQNYNNKKQIQQNKKQIQQKDRLTKSISKEKPIKLHQFLIHIIKSIGQQLKSILNIINQQLQKSSQDIASKLLRQNGKISQKIQFVDSNALFCIDLINSINNYNYTTKLKQSLGQVVEQQLIQKIIKYTQIAKQNKNLYKFNISIVHILQILFNLSIVCQRQVQIIQYLNYNVLQIFDTLIGLNKQIFTKPQSSQIQKNGLNLQHFGSSIQKVGSNHALNRQCLNYLCMISLILLKQTMSSYSKLGSRNKSQINEQIKLLKQQILSSIFVVIDQIVNLNQSLKEKICYKAIKNLLLSVFYLTIRENQCIPTQKQNPNFLLQFKYSILMLHKVFSLKFKKSFINNKNWESIVNNYQPLMRQLPSRILNPQEDSKTCNYHLGNTVHEEDIIKNHIITCEVVRNFRYMIISETKLQNKLIRLENIYYKNFLSPGWNYLPGDLISFQTTQQYKIICLALLHNNFLKLPIQIIFDTECLLICHRISQHKYKIVANIRYKKINSYTIQKTTIRMKLIGIQQLLLEFSTDKVLMTFKEYLSQNRNKTRQKQLKFINYYLNIYITDTQQLIQNIYQQDIQGPTQHSNSQIQILQQSTKTKYTILQQRNEKNVQKQCLSKDLQTNYKLQDIGDKREQNQNAEQKIQDNIKQMQVRYSKRKQSSQLQISSILIKEQNSDPQAI